MIKNKEGNWIVSHLPKNFESMNYIELFCGNGKLFFNKPKSEIEVLNDLDIGMIQIYRALRDEPAEFIRRLKICKYNEDTFNRSIKKTNLEDYLEFAVNEFILRKMSRGGLKKTFISKHKECRPGQSEVWNTSLKSLNVLSDRLKNAFIFNKQPIEILKSFNLKNSIIYINLSNQFECLYNENEKVQFFSFLKKSNSKIIIHGIDSNSYGKLFKGWKIQKRTNELKDKSKKIEFIWKNYDK